MLTIGEKGEKYDAGETRQTYFSAKITSELDFMAITIPIS